MEVTGTTVYKGKAVTPNLLEWTPQYARMEHPLLLYTKVCKYKLTDIFSTTNFWLALFLPTGN